MIEIRLDDEARQLPAGTTLAALLESLERPPASVATALNGSFIPRDRRAATVLGAGDQVLLFKPIVGG